MQIKTNACNSLARTACFQCFYISMNLLFSLQLYIQWCDDATAAEVCLDC